MDPKSDMTYMSTYVLVPDFGKYTKDQIKRPKDFRNVQN